jgi:outer membrane receptor protein involved in Fe transport
VSADRGSHVVRPRQARARGHKSLVAAAVASVLCGATSGTGNAAITGDAAAADADNALGEIIVTARKRSESLQDIPQSIDVFSKEDIEHLGIAQFEDYANRTPSISYISIGPGTQYFFMRGVSDGSNPNVSNTSTTGMFLDDLSVGYYGTIPDLHMYDIERIEVLNGPQGTLYGASAMAGAVRIITNKPDPSGGINGGFDDDVGTYQNHRLSDVTEGFLNIPLIEGQTAIRISGFYDHQGGFINNLEKTRDWVNGVVSTNAAWAGQDYNTQNVTGERFTLLNKFTDEWVLTLEADNQAQHHHGAWDQDVERYGVENVARFGPEYGTNHNLNTQGKIEGDVGFADFVYINGFFNQKSESVSEYSEYVQYANVPNGVNAAFVQSFACATAPGDAAGDTAYSGCNNPYQYTDYQNDTKRWSNEVRLISKGDGALHWIVGGYQERTTDWYSDFYAMPGLDLNGVESQYYLCGGTCPTNASGLPIYPAGVKPLPNEWYSSVSRSDEHQYALFGDIDYALTEQWKLSVGARWFESRVTGGSQYAGFYYQPKEPTFGSATFKKNTYKAELEYQPRPGRLYYFLFSQGFREGGFNIGLPATIPVNYEPDTLDNFELGWKTMSFGDALRWNGAAYYMPWKNYQTALYDAAITTLGSFNANVGDARIWGIESDLEARPTKRLTLTFSTAYNDSHLTSIKAFLNPSDQALFPIASGERLPYVPLFKATASARYDWPVGDSKTAFVQYDESHTGSMWSSLNLASSAVSGLQQRYLQPAYDLGTFRFGLGGANEAWSVEGYLNNVADTHAVIYINTGNFDKRETTNPPRMFGVRVKYRFGKTT